MNEACLNARWLREDLTHGESVEFTKDVLNHMRERLSDYQEQYGDLYNLEATPAESTAYRLAKHDVGCCGIRSDAESYRVQPQRSWHRRCCRRHR